MKKLRLLFISTLLACSTAMYSYSSNNDDWNDNTPAQTTTMTTTTGDWNDNTSAQTTTSDDWNDNTPAQTTTSDDWNDNTSVQTTSADNWNDNDNSYSSTTSSSTTTSSSKGGGSGIWIVAIIGVIIALIVASRKKKKAGKGDDSKKDAEKIEEPKQEEQPKTEQDMNISDITGKIKSATTGNAASTILESLKNRQQSNGTSTAQTTSSTSVAGEMYKVEVKGQVHGPYTLDEMIGFARQGRMNQNTKVMSKSGAVWKTVKDFPEISKYVTF